jgi:hypothetical protein
MKVAYLVIAAPFAVLLSIAVRAFAFEMRASVPENPCNQCMEVCRAVK